MNGIPLYFRAGFRQCLISKRKGDIEVRLKQMIPYCKGRVKIAGLFLFVTILFASLSLEEQCVYAADEFVEESAYQTIIGDASLHVYKTLNGGTIQQTGSNIGSDAFPQLTGYREYKATPAEHWEFEKWEYSQIHDGEELGNREAWLSNTYSFSPSRSARTTPYTGGNTICVNRVNTHGETIWNPISYTIKAHFNPMIRAEKTGSGTITNENTSSDPWGTVVNWGSNAAYTATASGGHIIKTLTVDGTVIPDAAGQPSYNYTFASVSAPHVIFAEFEPLYNITVQVEGKGTGTPVPENAAAGKEIELQATPEDGYFLEEWQVVSGNVAITDNKFIMPASDVIVKAVFSKAEYTVVGYKTEGSVSAIASVRINGTSVPEKQTSGGALTIPADAKEVPVEITFNPGFGFGRWFDNIVLRWGGVQSGDTNITNSSSPDSITMPGIEWFRGDYGSDRTDRELYLIIHTAELPKYSITIENDGNGTGSPSPASAPQGTEINLTADPNDGYYFKEWQVISGNVTITDNSFIMPGEDVVLMAVFEAEAPGNPYPPEGGDPDTPDGSGTDVPGDDDPDSHGDGSDAPVEDPSVEYDSPGTGDRSLLPLYALSAISAALGLAYVLRRKVRE